ncbi:B-box zinc finger 21 [Olea europaea subsp. europaea]|uniref:B-box zinc finger 21 n=1 Tax=Olea europaea subsp. europaea TaxID=158383 RepID=A0A8S0PK29_OLEEU|nr:B-box zinc finger 21 [Olea europaea subsp. europaea]
MKIQCDVCSKDEASVFCVADDAALCAACDHRVHHANKLAGKHQRFCLLHPSPKQAPLCDICQERKAFLFCQQDRAILCRECDISIHSANEKIQKHNRFLLTGVKLSATTALYSSLDSALTNVSETVPLIKCKKTLTDESVPVISKPTSTIPSTTSEPVKPVIADRGGGSVQLMNAGGNNGSSSTSSISEYLMEILPGYHVDDFLDSPCGFFKVSNDYFIFFKF